MKQSFQVVATRETGRVCCSAIMATRIGGKSTMSADPPMTDESFALRERLLTALLESPPAALVHRDGRFARVRLTASTDVAILRAAPPAELRARLAALVRGQ